MKTYPLLRTIIVVLSLTQLYSEANASAQSMQTPQYNLQPSVITESKIKIKTLYPGKVTSSILVDPFTIVNNKTYYGNQTLQLPLPSTLPLSSTSAVSSPLPLSQSLPTSTLYTSPAPQASLLPGSTQSLPTSVQSLSLSTTLPAPTPTPVQTDNTRTYGYRFALSTNMISIGSLGTLNLTGSTPVSRKLSIFSTIEYNPWTFRRESENTEIFSSSLSIGLIQKQKPASSSTESTNSINHPENANSINIPGSPRKPDSPDNSSTQDNMTSNYTHSNQFQSRKRSLSLGLQWHFHPMDEASLWLSIYLKAKEFNRGGITSSKTVEGDSLGAGISTGYRFPVEGGFFFDLGLGLWGGVQKVSTYSCPHCGDLLSTETKAFLLPDNLTFSVGKYF